jgi:Domain of unknown function (DUF4157)/Lysine-specific metallo-endopeptidase
MEMRTFVQKQNQPEKPESSNLARSFTATPWLHHHADLTGLTGTASPRFGHDFSRIPIHPPAAGAIQTKLAINNPIDEYEQEADRVAGQVMRLPEPRPQYACACGGLCPTCQTEQTGREQERLQPKRLQPGNLGQTAVPPIAHEVIRSSGQPLDPSVRAVMESRFGHDFSQVRVHTDARAVDSARALGALAYTVGRDVVFGAGQYVPDTAEGGRLLAHELTHVVQQSSLDDTSGKIVMRQPKKVEAKFSGCTGTQSNQIDSAVQDAKKALNKAASVVGSAYGKPTGLSAAHQQLLMDHFHTTSHGDLRTILGTYTSVGRAFDAGLIFECETTCPKAPTTVTCGYAYNTMWFGGRGPIHICFDTSGCDFAKTAALNRVALIIHEASHRHAGVDDKVYRWDAAKYNALSSKEAMDNADSYAWFAVLL